MEQKHHSDDHTPNTSGGPLAGLKVLELGQLIAGPFAGKTLADFGAEIIKIEAPGAGPAVQDLLGGNVDIFITTPASVVAQVKADKLKALGVTGNVRLASLPDVPTVSEAGFPQFKLDSWFALYAPAGTPADIVQTLNKAVGKILSQPEVQKKASDSGTTVELMTPAQLGAYTKSELDFWGKVIKTANVTLD